jgi:hypothetical protein
LFIGSTDRRSPFWPAGPTKQDFSPAFSSTDRKSSFWYVEPAKEDSMAEFKLSLTENCLFLYVEPTKQDLLAEFKLSLTENCLFGTFCQQKKTQCPSSNSTANLQSIHQKKVSFVFINHPSQHGLNSYRPAQAYASHSPGSNSSCHSCYSQAPSPP